MFENCFPNTLDTTVHYDAGEGDGNEDTFVYTGDIHAMWLRDSAAQVWPYVQFAKADPKVKKMIRGVIRRQLKCINIDPYANAFNKEPQPEGGWMNDITDMKPELHERKYEIDSLCYPIRLAYHYWQTTGDASVFDAEWQKAVAQDGAGHLPLPARNGRPARHGMQSRMGQSREARRTYSLGVPSERRRRDVPLHRALQLHGCIVPAQGG